MSNFWFTSDTHFGHRNILLPEYENRPFENVEHMDEALVERWNARVKTNDTVYHLGDFAFSNVERIKALLRQLHGRKFFIFGNHDKELRKVKNTLDYQRAGVAANVLRSSALNDAHDFKIIGFADYKELKFDDQRVVLFHYPLLTWNRRHYGAWHLHGHSHGHIKDDNEIRRLDVGVDSVGKYIGPHFDYSPISIEEIAMIMQGRSGGPQVDHHGVRDVSTNWL